MKISPFKYKYFDSEDELILEEELNLADTGIIYLAGKSGAGKSTFLKILKGFHPEFLPGELYSDFNSIDQALYLFQNPFNQIIHHHIKNELYFSAENAKIILDIDPEKNEELKHWLKILNLKEVLESNIPLKSLSHGENQRLLLLSLILAKPKVMLLDEPTAFLDQKNRKIVYQVLEELKKNSNFFLIDHHYDEVSPIIDTTLFFHREKNRLFISAKKNTESEKINYSFNIESLSETIFSEKFKLEVKDLSFHYNENKKIFENLSFVVNSGECLAIVGKSGVGKSTLFKILLGELKAQKGEILIPYGDVFRSCSVLFQNPELHFLYESVEEEIQGNELVKKIPEIISSMKLEGKLKLNPFLLSEGEKRRLSFLVAQNKLKPIILLDEPTFGLDIEQVVLIQELIRFYKKLGAAVVVISHDPDFYEKIAEKILDLEKNEMKSVHE